MKIFKNIIIYLFVICSVNNINSLNKELYRKIVAFEPANSYNALIKKLGKPEKIEIDEKDCWYMGEVDNFYVIEYKDLKFMFAEYKSKKLFFTTQIIEKKNFKIINEFKIGDDFNYIYKLLDLKNKKAVDHIDEIVVTEKIFNENIQIIIKSLFSKIVLSFENNKLIKLELYNKGT